MNSANLWSLAGRYDNPIPTRFLAPIDCFNIPAQRRNIFEFLPQGEETWKIKTDEEKTRGGGRLIMYLDHLNLILMLCFRIFLCIHQRVPIVYKTQG